MNQAHLKSGRKNDKRTNRCPTLGHMHALWVHLRLLDCAHRIAAIAELAAAQRPGMRAREALIAPAVRSSLPFLAACLEARASASQGGSDSGALLCCISMTTGHGFRRCSPAAGLLACLVVLPAAPGIALVALQPGVRSAASVFGGHGASSNRGRPLATGWRMAARRKISPTQRRLIDEALQRLNARPDEPEGAELISDAHAMLSPERRVEINWGSLPEPCLLYTSPSPRDQRGSRMPSSA